MSSQFLDGSEAQRIAILRGFNSTSSFANVIFDADAFDTDLFWVILSCASLAPGSPGPKNRMP